MPDSQLYLFDIEKGEKARLDVKVNFFIMFFKRDCQGKMKGYRMKPKNISSI